MNIKTYDEIMAGIDFAIRCSPKYSLQRLGEINQELDKLNDELEIEGYPRKDIDVVDVAKKYGVKYIEFDKNGKLIKVLGYNKVKDWRKEKKEK